MLEFAATFGLAFGLGLVAILLDARDRRRRPRFAGTVRRVKVFPLK